MSNVNNVQEILALRVSVQPEIAESEKERGRKRERERGEKKDRKKEMK
jgi:hypothetical protein